MIDDIPNYHHTPVVMNLTSLTIGKKNEGSGIARKDGFKGLLSCL